MYRPGGKYVDHPRYGRQMVKKGRANAGFLDGHVDTITECPREVMTLQRDGDGPAPADGRPLATAADQDQGGRK